MEGPLDSVLGTVSRRSPPGYPPSLGQWLAVETSGLGGSRGRPQAQESKQPADLMSLCAKTFRGKETADLERESIPTTVVKNSQECSGVGVIFRVRYLKFTTSSSQWQMETAGKQFSAEWGAQLSIRKPLRK